MRKLKLLALTIIAFLAFSCAKSELPQPPATSVEYKQACDTANKGKVVAVQGFLDSGTTTPCLKMMGLNRQSKVVRECAFKLLDNVNIVGKEIIVYAPEGKEKNEVETPDADKSDVKPTSLFPRENLKIRLSDGTEVVPQATISTPVTVTGKVSLTQGSSSDDVICSIHATKIEKR